MLRLASIALLLDGSAAAAVPNRRKLSYDLIANYAPGSQVTEHNAIDLDQQGIENALKEAPPNYVLAGDIYNYGGNSKVTADIVTTVAIDSEFSSGDAISGTRLNGNSMAGALTSNPSGTGASFKYTTYDTQANYNGGCVGVYNAGSGATITAATSGCVNAGTVTITKNASFSATYTLASVLQKAGRTLKGFSTQTKSKMYDAHASSTARPYKEYLHYYNYYGDFNYADTWVQGALAGTDVTYSGAAPDVAFSGLSDSERIEAIKKGTAYLNVWMYTIREFYDAIDDCNAGDVTRNDAPVHAWDEGVAFYAGSLAGQTGSTYGVLLYNLADKRCENFKTCGVNGDTDTKSDHAAVNHKLDTHFGLGQYYAVSGRCNDAIAVLEDIVSQMSVPLIQGTLRYAYKVDRLSGGAKEKAEGAVFAASILPRVHACSPVDAVTIRDNMKFGAASTTFLSVKTAFENNYACMNVTCAEIGGLYQGPDYYPDANPCAPPPPPVSTNTVTVTEKGDDKLPTGGLIAIIVCGALAAILCSCVLFIYTKEKSSGKPVFHNLGTKAQA